MKLPPQVEVICYLKQHKHRRLLGELMKGGQIPAADIGFISPRLFVALLLNGFAEQTSTAPYLDPLMLLRSALENCGTVAQSLVRTAAPADRLDEDGTCALLMERDAFLIFQGETDPVRIMGEICNMTPGGAGFAIRVAMDENNTFGITSGPFAGVPGACQAVGWINRNGVPPANLLRGVRKVARHENGWISSKPIFLVEEDYGTHPAVINGVLGVCQESGCLVMGDTSLPEEARALIGERLTTMDDVLKIMARDPKKSPDLTMNYMTDWWQAFNGQVIMARFRNGGWCGRSATMHTDVDTDLSTIHGIYRRGFMELGAGVNPLEGKSEFKTHLQEYPGIPSLICRWGAPALLERITTLEPKRYQVRGGYGHPNLWSAGLVTLIQARAEMEVRGEIVPELPQDIFSAMLTLDTYVIYLSPQIVTAFQQTDVPDDCTLAEMGMPAKRLRILLPRGACRLETPFGACDAHSVLLEKKGESLMVAACCEGPGGTQFFFETKPWDNTIGGIVRRTSPERLDFNLKKRYAALADGWSGYTLDSEFDKILDRVSPSVEEEVFWREVVSLAAQALLVMTMKPEWVTPEVQERKAKIKKGRVVRDAIWQPNILGANYQVKNEKSTPRTDEDAGGSHASPRFHWRRGHWRNQVHGEGRTLRKFIWVEPMAVGVQD